MVQLEGSEKQVKWATDIRAVVIHDAQVAISDMHKLDWVERAEGLQVRLDRFLAYAADARWWINHRGVTMRYLLTTQEERAGNIVMYTDPAWSPEAAISSPAVTSRRSI